MTEAQPVPVAEVQPQARVNSPQSATPGKPEEQQPAPLLPKDPESFAMATLKGAVEATATFVKEAATPWSQASEPVTPVRIFDKEPPSLNIPDAVRDAFRQKTAEQMFGKREVKAAAPARARATKPTGAPERKAETARQQNIAGVRSQLAKAA